MKYNHETHTTKIKTTINFHQIPSLLFLIDPPIKHIQLRRFKNNSHTADSSEQPTSNYRIKTITYAHFKLYDQQFDVTIRNVKVCMTTFPITRCPFAPAPTQGRLESFSG